MTEGQDAYVFALHHHDPVAASSVIENFLPIQTIFSYSGAHQV